MVLAAILFMVLIMVLALWGWNKLFNLLWDDHDPGLEDDDDLDDYPM